MTRLLVLLVVILLGIVGWLAWRDRSYLRKKTSETMSDAVWKELEAERAQQLERRRKFRAALEAAKENVTKRK